MEPQSSTVTNIPALDFSPEPTKEKEMGSASPRSDGAQTPGTPRLEMSMRSPERSAANGSLDEMSKDNQGVHHDGWLQGLHDILDNNPEVWEGILRFCGVALAAYIGAYVRIACSRLRVSDVRCTPSWVQPRTLPILMHLSILQKDGA